jgi:hypothetical protein
MGKKLILLIALTWAPFAAAQGNNGVVGRWRSLETSKGGIGGLFTFHTDGTLEFSPGAVVFEKYRVEGDRLITPPGTLDGPEEVQVIKSVTTETLRLSMGQSMVGLEMTREGKPEDPNNPLVGVWARKGSVDAERWQFQKDGTVLSPGRPTPNKGHYTFNSDQLRMQFGGIAMDGILRWDGDVPVLRVERVEPVMEMTREGKPQYPKDLLLGTWTLQIPGPERRPAGIWQFRASGMLLMTMPFRTDKGHYILKGDQIRLEIEGHPPVEGRFRWDGDVLVIPSPSGMTESRFERY